MKRQYDATAQALDALATEMPNRDDLQRCYTEVAEKIRNEDLNAKEVERVLRLLRKRVVSFISVSDLLEKWSLYNGR